MKTPSTNLTLTLPRLEETLAEWSRHPPEAKQVMDGGEPESPGSESSEVATERMLVVAVDVASPAGTPQPVDYLSWPVFFIAMIGILGVGAGVLHVLGETR